ncbi:MAG: class I SAM-dependent methyltransferase [Candidatus Omnitrophica bacterium]|nr:class I SAM-dependent methyltransferase [Candidatus Omnitrophota bacterium]
MTIHESLRPGGSGILPEETPPKFLAGHLSAYHFALPYLKAKDVLEIGFGDGYGADFLAGHANSVMAVDALEKNVKLASAKYKRNTLDFRQASCGDLHFSDEVFDAVVAFHVIEHIPEADLVKSLEAINRVLKKGGTAFISTLNLDKNKKPNRPYEKNPFHIKEFTYAEFDSLIKGVFPEYEIHGLFYGPRLRFYERLKKLGIFVSGFYNNITVAEFVWKEQGLRHCVDFMAMCHK